ncbi:MAG: GntR family transcriptional regulator [Oscillospiraceae bacterium]
MRWSINSDKPVYLQLIEEIELRIITGLYPLGEKLPSVRDLAEEAAVNPNTMQKAMAELERCGLVYSQRTTGRFITEDKELVLSIKNGFAKEHIREYLTKMKKLGFSKQQANTMLDEYEKEMD